MSEVGRRHRIYSISVAMRDMLIEHLDGVKVPFVVSMKVNDGLLSVDAQHRLQTTNALILRGYIRKTKSQKYTVITTNGRYMLGQLLGDYADALVRAYEMLGNNYNPEWAVSLAGVVLANKTKALIPELV